MFCINIAGITVQIDNRYAYVETLCQDYLCHDTPDFRVSVMSAELDDFIAHVGRPMTAGEAESHMLYRHICGRMPAYDAYLLHAAVVEMDGRGYAFSARRGAGKTTHASLWEAHFGSDRARIINGDKPILRRDASGRFCAWGTPWCGKEGKQINASCPLTAICFLEQASVNRITPSPVADTAARLLEATLLPPTSHLQDRMAALVGATVRDIPAFLLECRSDEEAVQIAYDALRKV